MKNCVSFCFVFLISVFNLWGQPGVNDVSFNVIDDCTFGGSGFNDDIYYTAVQLDGKIIVVGVFTAFNNIPRNKIARLNLDGSLDMTFDPGLGFDASANVIAIQADGKIIIGGNFATYNGASAGRLVRLNTDGSQDLTFNIGTGFTGSARLILIQPDGKLIVGGYFTSFNGTARNRIARLNADGTLDTSFNPGTGFNERVLAGVLQPDGKMILGGAFTSFNGTGRNRIARLNSNGTIDLTFNPGTGFNERVVTISLQTDGKTIVGGNFTTFNGATKNYIVRLNTNGTNDATFITGTAFDFWVFSSVIQLDGKIVLGGAFVAFNGVPTNRIVRLNSDGTLDPTFNIGAGFDNWVESVARQADSKIIAVGRFLDLDGTCRNKIARLEGNCTGANSSSSSINAFDCALYSQNGQTFNASGTYTQIISNFIGCDSTITINLVIGNTDTTLNAFACASFTENGQTYTTSGIYSQTIPNTIGCDSIITINLTIGNSTSTINPTACNSYTQNAQTFTTSGTYVQVIPNFVGCDSTITINLTINQNSTSFINPVACDTYTENGQTYTTSGTYLQVIPNFFGCDSTITIDLTILDATDSTINAFDCNSFTENGQTYTTSGTYLQTLTNMVGCDSTITINLTIGNTDTTLNAFACSSFTENGQTFTTSGIYTQIIPNTIGCDSIITINLTIGNSVSTINPIACDSHTENGQTYTLSGTYIQVIPNMVGCDSTITINLTINQSSAATINPIACDSYTENAQTFTSSGTYIQVIPTVGGCDSTVTINLTLNQSSDTTINAFACFDFTENGQTYTASGTYIQTIPNIAGCDSTITINLIIGNTISTINPSACNSYTANGQTYTASGTYVQTIPNMSGCDSTITINLTVTTINSGVTQTITTLTSLAGVASFQWLDCDNLMSQIVGENQIEFVASTTGNFAVEITQGGCIDTSVCFTITNQNFYDLPGYISLLGEVFAFPVTAIDTCDALALAFAEGGVAPYSYDWFTQANNEDSDILDSLCEGFHTLKITDNIGDSIFVDYYVTDTANFNNWYDTLFTGFVDTIYMAAPNCLIDYSIPLDSATISDFYYLSADTIPLMDLYFIEITYYQAGNTYSHQDTISVGLGWYLIDFSVYCPIKSFNNIKTILLDLNYPTLLGIDEPNQDAEWFIYPNPTRGVFVLSGLSENSKVEVVNILGELIISQTVSTNQLEINLTNFADGLYLVRVYNDAGYYTKSLVKQ